MAIKDLQVRQGNVDIVVDIVDVGDVRQFEKFGRQGRVATAVAKDETGDIKFTLWNDQIDQVKAGDKVHITNGFVSEWQGEKQLTTGKMGKLEVVNEGQEAKKEMTEPPNEEEDRKIYEEAEKNLEDIEERLEDTEENPDEKVDVEDVEDQ